MPYEGTFQKFLRENLGVKLLERGNTAVFFYNIWEPFRLDINEKMIYEIAEALETKGAEYLILNEGWQDLMGDNYFNRFVFFIFLSISLYNVCTLLKWVYPSSGVLIT